jgi:hypothetical protein
MTATVLAFPSNYFPHPKKNLVLPAPYPGYGGSLVTSSDDARDAMEWYWAFRLLVIIPPNFDQQSGELVEVDRSTCHRALTALSIEFSRSCFGDGAELLRMIAVLEGCGLAGLYYTILFDVPEHARMSTLLDIAKEAFQGLVARSDHLLPGITVSEMPARSEVVHLLGRTMIVADTD